MATSILTRGYINGSSQPLEGFNRDGHCDLSSNDTSFLIHFDVLLTSFNAWFRNYNDWAKNEKF